LAKPEHGKIISAYAVDPEAMDVEELTDELVMVTKLIKDGPDRWPAGVVKYDISTRTRDARQVKCEIPFYCYAIMVPVDVQEIN
jgi:hypothetical protein